MNRTLTSFRSSVARIGLRATLLLSIKHPYYVALRTVHNIRDRPRVHKLRASLKQFDEHFGVDTHTEASLTELKMTSANAAQGVDYVAVSQEHFTLAMNSVDIRHEDFEFVDLGSGKGKALLLASDYPFERIIGVEFSLVLHRIALANIARYRSPTQRCWNIESICQDATEFEFPLSPLVVYLYNPFGPDIVGRVLDRLETSLSIHPRPCMVVMVNPRRARVLRERGKFDECAAGEAFATFRHRSAGV